MMILDSGLLSGAVESHVTVMWHMS